MRNCLLKLTFCLISTLFVVSCNGIMTHHYATEWSHDENYHWHACTDNGYEDLKSDLAPHVFTEVETPATDTDEGFITHTCICGYSYVTEIPYDNDQGLQFLLQDDNTWAVSVGNATRLTKIRIPKTYNGKVVTTIAENGFYHHETLTFISLPDTITTIERSAFEGCCLLKDLAIPSSVTSIGEAAFCGCEALTSKILLLRLKEVLLKVVVF